ncbi:MAG: ATP-binding cassette domain-containing protein [Saprospiraceae bacterium]|nr:ATP-binding cassette domain-containing protein [Saprospiraceae bacterium]
MIFFDNVIPAPLKENGLNPTSQVFNTQTNFEHGKNYLITAPSGKGKSTFLHLLFGLRADYQGVIKIDDKNIRQFSLDNWATLRQEKLSIVFQDLRLFPNLSALENILIKQSLKPSVSPQEAQNMAERLGVAPFLSQKTDTLSYGQRQRVAIVRALCQPFNLLLLDEPFSHLDVENIKIASHLIQERCAAQNASLIMVSLGDEYFFDYDERKII